MAKDKTEYRCNSCGCISTKWMGRCSECGEWNSLEERRVAPEAAPRVNRFAGYAGSSPLVYLNQVKDGAFDRVPTGLPEFDRVLGGGVVRGSVVILAGEPGVGKSTLLLQAMEGFHKQDINCVLVGGEESAAQVADRARRLGMGGLPLRYMGEVVLEKIIAMLEEQRPDFVIVDSVATVFTEQLTSAPGGVSQIKECLGRLTRWAKDSGCGIICIGHSTKTSDIAGPMAAMHIVDAVCTLSSGDATSNYRVMRASKNRFGSTQEIGLFHMSETGMKSVTNPSAIFLSTHNAPVPGACVFASVDGTRPMLIEVQALVDGSSASPRRLSVGVERDRLSMLLAVLNRHGQIQTADQDVYVNIVSGLEIAEPAVDLAVTLAIQSSIRGKALPRGLLCFGEVGLAGEVRPSPKGQERLGEAAKLGFSAAIIPKANMPRKSIAGMQLYPVERVDQALQAVMALP